MNGYSFTVLQQDLQALLLTVDVIGRVLSAGDALGSLLGCNEGEVSGRFLAELVDSADVPELEKSLSKAFSSHEPVTFTVRFRSAGGSCIAVEWRGRTIMGCEPDMRILPLLGHDVTGLHHRISHLELLAGELQCVRELNHLIARERDPQRLIEKCCEILIRSGCLSNCYILLMKDGELSCCAGSGEPEMVEILHKMVEQRKPPRCLVQVPDHPDEPLPEETPELCNDCPALMYFTPQTFTLSVTIESEGNAYGRLKAAFPPEVAVDSERIAFLREAASDIAFALQSIELEKERDRRTDELRVTRDRMAAILNASPAAILSMSPDGRVTSWNRAAEEIFGWKAEEVMGEYLPIVQPEKREEFDALRNRVMEGNPLRAHELQRVRRDGSPVTVQVSNAALMDPGGAVEGIMSIVLDVTDQAEMREKLRQSEELFRAAFDNASIGRSLTSIDGRLLRVNGMMCHQLGYTAEELLTMTINDITHPDDCPRSFDAVKRLISKEAATIRFEKRYIRRDGTVFWVELHATLLRDKDDRPLHFITDILDITERRMALEKLEEERSRLRQILDSYPNGVYMVNGSFDIQYINPYLERAFGPVGGRKCFEFFHDLSSQCPWCVNDRVMKGETVRWEWASPKNGRIYDLFDAPFINSDGTVSKLEFFNDITEHRQTEDQLRFVQKMDAVGRLAGGIAHDFNNLLTVINSYSEIAAERLGQNEPVRADILEVLRAGEQAASLTKQLLAFSRKQIFKPQVLNINRTVCEMRKMLSRILGEDVTLEVRLAEDPGNICADPGQVEQILMNLAVNARDAMPKGGVLAIETSAVYLDSDYASHHAEINEGRYVRLTVKDTGSGMDRETVSKIFEPFFTTKDLGKGTGLGLATVYGIVKQSGGDISVCSEPGLGTTFNVFLPCTEEPVPESKAPLDEQKPSGSETVLLVEDDEAVRKLTEQILKDAGYKVLTAAGSSEAMEIFTKHGRDIALLLTDMVMPRMSGMDLAKSLIQQKPDLRILCMSGYTDNAMLNHRKLESDISLIDKPFSVSALVEKVREVIARESDGKT